METANFIELLVDFNGQFVVLECSVGEFDRVADEVGGFKGEFIVFKGRFIELEGESGEFEGQIARIIRTFMKN